jgi:hypothetical protein
LYHLHHETGKNHQAAQCWHPQTHCHLESWKKKNIKPPQDLLNFITVIPNQNMFHTCTAKKCKPWIVWCNYFILITSLIPALLLPCYSIIKKGKKTQVASIHLRTIVLKVKADLQQLPTILVRPCCRSLGVGPWTLVKSPFHKKKVIYAMAELSPIIEKDAMTLKSSWINCFALCKKGTCPSSYLN